MQSQQHRARTDGVDQTAVDPRRAGVGPVLEPFAGVERIAVLRGGGLGDLLFAMPAIDALAAAYPKADITLLGTPVHAALLRDRPGPVSAVEVLPFAAGVRPGAVEDPEQIEDFFSRMRRRPFDLALQMHGGGRYANPFLLRLQARHTVGSSTEDAARLERSMPYLYYQNEVARFLEIAGLAGAPPVSLEPALETTAEERESAAAMLQPHLLDSDHQGLIAIHPGATDLRRRWPVESFAKIAAWAAADGCRVLVVGDDGDAALADDIVQRARAAIVNRPGSGEDARATTDGASIRSVAGELNLGQLAALLQLCDVVVGNDSGPRHLAQAVGTPTVGVYWVGNALSAAPWGRSMHRVQLSWQTQCPVCGIDATRVGPDAERCAHDDSFVRSVRAEDVYLDVNELRATNLLPRGR